MKYSVEISLILNGQYYPDSDIHIATFNNYTDAYAVASNIDVQDSSLYECYIYTLDENSEIIEEERIF